MSQARRARPGRVRARRTTSASCKAGTGSASADPGVVHPVPRDDRRHIQPPRRMQRDRRDRRRRQRQDRRRRRCADSARSPAPSPSATRHRAPCSRYRPAAPAPARADAAGNRASAPRAPHQRYAIFALPTCGNIFASTRSRCAQSASPFGSRSGPRPPISSRPVWSRRKYSNSLRVSEETCPCGSTVRRRLSLSGSVAIDEGVHRDHAAAQAGNQVAAVAVGRHHHLIRGNTRSALGRHHPAPVAPRRATRLACRRGRSAPAACAARASPRA